MPETVWRMFAHQQGDALTNVGPRFYVELHGLPYPIVEVEVRRVSDEKADDQGAATHWGWLASGEAEPSMMWPWWGAFSMCFPYGPKAEVEAGNGEIVRLHISVADVPEVPDAG